jgi:hypothetical protein
MATASLPRRAKVEVADLTEVSKAYSFGIAAHLSKDIGNVSHANMISLLVALSSCEVTYPT